MRISIASAMGWWVLTPIVELVAVFSIVLGTAQRGLAQAPSRPSTRTKTPAVDAMWTELGLPRIGPASDMALVAAAPKLADSMHAAYNAAFQVNLKPTDDLFECFILCAELEIVAAGLANDRRAELSALQKHVDRLSKIARYAESLYRVAARDWTASTYHKVRFQLFTTSAHLANRRGRLKDEVSERERAVEEAKGFFDVAWANYEQQYVDIRAVAEGRRYQRDAWIALAKTKKDEPSRVKVQQLIDEYLQAAEGVEARSRALRATGSRGGSDWEYFNSLLLVAEAKAVKAKIKNDGEREIAVWQDFQQKAPQVVGSLAAQEDILWGVATERMRRIDLYHRGNIRLTVLRQDRDAYVRLLNTQAAEYLEVLQFVEDQCAKGRRQGRIDNLLLAASHYTLARLKMAQARRSRYMGHRNGRAVLYPPIE